MKRDPRARGRVVRRPRPGLRNPGLRRLELAFLGSTMGHWTYVVGLSVYAYEQGGTTAVGVITVLRLLPAALASPFLATLADRYRRERVMMATDLVRAVLMVVATVVIATDGPAVVVYAVVVLTNVVGVAFRPAQAALLPGLARTPAELSAANVAASTLEAISTFAGPAIGGVVLAFWNVPAVFGLNAPGSSSPQRCSSACGRPRPRRRRVRSAARAPELPRRSQGRARLGRQRPERLDRDGALHGTGARRGGAERPSRARRAGAARRRELGRRLPQRRARSRRLRRRLRRARARDAQPTRRRLRHRRRPLRHPVRSSSASSSSYPVALIGVRRRRARELDRRHRRPDAVPANRARPRARTRARGARGPPARGDRARWARSRPCSSPCSARRRRSIAAGVLLPAATLLAARRLAAIDRSLAGTARTALLRRVPLLASSPSRCWSSSRVVDGRHGNGRRDDPPRGRRRRSLLRDRAGRGRDPRAHASAPARRSARSPSSATCRGRRRVTAVSTSRS